MRRNHFVGISSFGFEEFNIHLEEVEKEWDAQIERFFSFGLKPSHFDSHHHIHSWDPLIPVVVKLANKYNLPVRKVYRNQIENVPFLSDQLLTDFYGEHVHDAYFEQLSNKVQQVQSVEIMCHPAYLDLTLIQHSSYQEQRMKELEVLTSVSLPTGFKLAAPLKI